MFCSLESTCACVRLYVGETAALKFLQGLFFYRKSCKKWARVASCCVWFLTLPVFLKDQRKRAAWGKKPNFAVWSIPQVCSTSSQGCESRWNNVWGCIAVCIQAVPQQLCHAVSPVLQTSEMMFWAHLRAKLPQEPRLLPKQCLDPCCSKHGATFTLWASVSFSGFRIGFHECRLEDLLIFWSPWAEQGAYRNTRSL